MSSKAPSYRKTIERLERMRSSSLGNPRFLIHFTDGTTATTEPNGSVAYGLENRENIGAPVDVWAHRSGTVYNVVPVTEEG